MSYYKLSTNVKSKFRTVSSDKVKSFLTFEHNDSLTLSLDTLKDHWTFSFNNLRVLSTEF